MSLAGSHFPKEEKETVGFKCRKFSVVKVPSRLLIMEGLFLGNKVICGLFTEGGAWGE